MTGYWRCRKCHRIFVGTPPEEHQSPPFGTLGQPMPVKNCHEVFRRIKPDEYERLKDKWGEKEVQP